MRRLSCRRILAPISILSQFHKGRYSISREWEKKSSTFYFNAIHDCKYKKKRVGTKYDVGKSIIVLVYFVIRQYSSGSRRVLWKHRIGFCDEIFFTVYKRRRRRKRRNGSPFPSSFLRAKVLAFCPLRLSSFSFWIVFFLPSFSLSSRLPPFFLADFQMRQRVWGAFSRFRFYLGCELGFSVALW